MKEATTYQDGVPTKSPFTQAEKDLAKLYPNFTKQTWEMVKNVNLVMKIMLGLFIAQGIGLLLFIATQL